MINATEKKQINIAPKQQRAVQLGSATGLRPSETKDILSNLRADVSSGRHVLLPSLPPECFHPVIAQHRSAAPHPDCDGLELFGHW